jgi:hypothetical protein
MNIFGLFIPFAYFCAFYLLGIAADIISTKIAIDRGLREGNPLLAKTDNPLAVSGLVSLITVIFAIIEATIESSTMHASMFCLIFALYRTTLAVLNVLKINKANSAP